MMAKNARPTSLLPGLESDVFVLTGGPLPTLQQAVDELHRLHIQRVKAGYGNVTRSAKAIGVSRSTMRRWLKRPAPKEDGPYMYWCMDGGLPTKAEATAELFRLHVENSMGCMTLVAAAMGIGRVTAYRWLKAFHEKADKRVRKTHSTPTY